jgi:hypothetical protein
MARESSYEPLVTVVGFHHARCAVPHLKPEHQFADNCHCSRGPEIESWFGTKGNIDPATENDWSLLPFMALSDGAHTCVSTAFPMQSSD